PAAPADGGPDSLFRVDWVSAPAEARAAPATCVVLGPDVFDLAPALAAPIAAAPAELTEVPAAVVAPIAGDSGGRGPAGVHELTARVLGLAQSWLADDRFAGSRLVIVTRGAVATADEDAPDLAAAAIWGLIRSAQAE